MTRYKHYKIKGKPTTLGADHGINIAFDSKEIFVETEVKIYPFESFLAEFGGALGLFLGFSFMTIWDGMTGMMISVMELKKVSNK